MKHLVAFLSLLSFCAVVNASTHGIIESEILDVEQGSIRVISFDGPDVIIRYQILSMNVGWNYVQLVSLVSDSSDICCKGQKYELRYASEKELGVGWLRNHGGEIRLVLDGDHISFKDVSFKVNGVVTKAINRDS